MACYRDSFTVFTSALNVFNKTPKLSMCTMFVMFTDELFLGSGDNMFYSYRALIWAGEVEISCTTDSARMLHNKHLCSRHFSESNFTTAGRVHLKRVAVPHGSNPAPQSLPQPPVSSLKTLLRILCSQL
jgi:hypothetical protein